MSSCSKMSRNSAIRRLPLISGAVALVAGMCLQASATPVMLTDGNAIATIDSVTGNVSYLSVGGVPQLAAQNLYFTLGGDSAPQSFGTLDETSVAAYPADLFLNYEGAGFTAQINYQLTGGLGGPTDTAYLSTSVLVNSSSQTDTTFNVFEYDHLTLDDATNSRISVDIPDNAILQKEIGGRGALSSVTPIGDEYEVGLTPTIFNSLSSPVTLNDQAGPYTGDVEFATESENSGLNLQSSVTVFSLDSFNPGVPVPPAIWMGLTTLVGIGGVGLVRRRVARA